MEKGLTQPAITGRVIQRSRRAGVRALAATSVCDYLSGLLNWRGGGDIQRAYRASRVVLVGEHSLSARYQQAMAARGLAPFLLLRRGGVSFRV